ncbi:hypothetical protein BH10BAC3_BH10BAC3_35430 [soil metagenome]
MHLLVTIFLFFIGQFTPLFKCSLAATIMVNTENVATNNCSLNQQIKIPSASLLKDSAHWLQLVLITGKQPYYKNTAIVTLLFSSNNSHKKNDTLLQATFIYVHNKA